MDLLIAHASGDARRTLADSLAPLGLRLGEAADGEGAVYALQKLSPRVVLIDWDLPDVDGPDFCRVARDLRRKDRPYIIVLAGGDHHGQVEIALNAGADDCVRAPVMTAELLARVGLAERSLGTQPGGSAPCSDMERVLDRDAAILRLGEELARARRSKNDLSVGVLDIHGLTTVEAEFGRTAADAVLYELTARIRAELRPYDRLGRLECSELLLILPDAPEQETCGVLQRVKSAIARTPFEYQGRALDVCVSMGGACGREESPGELVAKARDALEEARDCGPGNVVAGPLAVLEALLARD